MAARAIGRPVRLELTRRQLYTGVGFRPATVQHVALGAGQDGRLAAIVHEAVGQTSTYEEFAEATIDAALTTYACADRRTRYRLVEMNTNTPCPMRGPGHTTGLLAQEIAMDELAVALSMDPIDLRLRNFADRDPRRDLPWSSNQLRECYRAGAERFGWNRRDPRPRAVREGRDLVGVGMAAAMSPSPMYPTSASATLFADGTAMVRCATSDMGPGTTTMMTQVAADALGLAPSCVRVELGDTNLPEAKEHGGSTTTASVGSAVLDACTKVLDRLRAVTGENRPSADGLHDGLRRAGLDHIHAEGNAAPNSANAVSTYGFGAVFAEVRVDADFGTVRATRIVGAYDAGCIVNPKLARSQCIGGMVGGIGMALLEEAEWDDRLGRVVNANIAEYLVPVHADVAGLDVVFIEGRDPSINPLGIKGLAELGLCGVAPSIANAVFNATGVRVRQVPIVPRRLLDA